MCTLTGRSAGFALAPGELLAHDLIAVVQRLVHAGNGAAVRGRELR
jgi:hypothetical protein